MGVWVHECVVGKLVCIHVYGLMGVPTCVAGRWVCIDVCVVSSEWVWWVYECAEDGCTCSWMCNRCYVLVSALAGGWVCMNKWLVNKCVNA